MLSAVGRFFQSLLLGSIALFKRALCFLSRKRRDSGAILPTHVKSDEVSMPAQVLSDNFQFPAPSHNHVEQPPTAPLMEEIPEEEQVYTEWDTWDQPTLSAPVGDYKQQHVPNSSKQLAPEPEPEPDYFSDLGLAPTIKKQKKVLVKSAVEPSHQTTERSNRLAFVPDQAIPISAELEEWDESTGAWEDEDLTVEAEQAMRQTRKAERERRLAEHQRRNQEKEQKKLSKDSSRLATKLS